MDFLDALIPVSAILCIFGVFYIHYTTRHRERMSLIDKGLDVSLIRPNTESILNVRRMIILNIALTLIGIGLGITLGMILFAVFKVEAVYPASIFLMAGLGLLVSTMMSRKSNDRDSV